MGLGRLLREAITNGVNAEVELINAEQPDDQVAIVCKFMRRLVQGFSR